ncbi:MAG: hypothetical protein ACREPI_05425 [Candidatus Dormibacterales bacterium]
MDRSEAEAAVRWHEEEVTRSAMNIYEAETMMRWRAEEVRRKADERGWWRSGAVPGRRSIASALAQLLKLA